MPRFRAGCIVLLALIIVPVLELSRVPQARAQEQTAPAKKAAPAPAAQPAAPPAQAPAAQPQAAPAPAQPSPTQTSPTQPPPTQAAPPATDPQSKEDAAPVGLDRAIERAKSRIQDLEARADVAPAIREQALTLLRNALGQWQAAQANEEAATRFQDGAKRAPERVAEAKQQLEALQKEPGDEEFAKRIEKLALAEAQQALDAANGEAATLKTDLGQIETRLRDMNTRATAAREEQSAEKQALDALENPDTMQVGADDPIVVDARRSALVAERRARASKINQLEQELISLPARQASATARRDLAAAKLEKLAKRIPIVEARVNYLKEAEAARQREEADREARKLARQHPVLEAYVKDTEVIRQREAEAEKGIDAAKAALTDVKSDIARVADSKTAAQQVLEIGSIGGDFSELLRAMRAQLPSTAQLAGNIWERDQAIVDARLKRLRAEEGRRALTDTKGMAERVLSASVKKGEAEPGPDVLPALEKLVAARRALYVQLHDRLVAQIAQLAELNGAERDLLNQTTALRGLLNSRLLWLPSSAPVGVGWLDQVRASFSWIGDPAAWKETGQELLERATDRPFPTAIVLVLFGALVLFTRRLRARLTAISEAVGRYSTDTYWRTPEALLISALLALKTPLIFGYAGWLLTRLPQASDFVAGVGAGLIATASLLTFLRFVQYVCVENGLFSVHFGWPERARAVLWQNVQWLKYALAPPAFILAMIGMSSSQSLRDGLGRFAFLAAGVATALFLWRIAHPRWGIFAERLAPGHPLWMTRVVWHTLLTLVPLAIAGIALWGYYDAAAQIQDGLILSVAIICGAFLIYSVAMREVLVARRRLEIRRALERREKARVQRAQQEAAGETPSVVLEEPEVDIASISEQTRKLVRLVALLLLAATLYFFWREALPSLALLDVPLWQQSTIVDGAMRTVPITVSNVIIALAIAAVTFIAARNLPGLLEITALHRLRIEAGTRYAVSAVSRYLIAIIGLVFAARSVGFDWSQVQWIVAALGVGVGFGLQEIVANFISGLIILFERPVRVGDTVTIGDLTGTVSRIHIRATSMTDGENREIIIPNKLLITEKVINWTLTDSITRVTLKVAVRYGTDTLRAQMAILGAVKATPQVLDNPPPSVFFIGFGTAALEFEVRAFVLQLAHRSTVINDLHVAIERALREQEIAMS